MSISKSLAMAGLMAAVAGVAVAAPTVKLKSGGAKSGQKGPIAIWAIPSGAAVTGAVLNIKFDDTKMAVSTADLTAGTGWVINDKAVTGNTLSLAMSNTDGQTVDGPIVTVMAQQNSTAGLAGGASALTLLTGSNISDADFNQYDVGPLNAAFLPGTTTDLGGTISGSVSVSPTAVAAVVTSGTATNLRLIKAADLTDIATAPLPAPISGRPAFGFTGGASVVAVGDNNGNLSVFNAETGAAIGAALPLGSKASTPAIESSTTGATAGNIYVGADKSGAAPVLVRVKSGAVDTSMDLTGTTVPTAPVFVAGGLAVATDTQLVLVRDSGTGTFVPQTTVNGTFGASSPVAKASGKALIAGTDGKITQFDLVKGVVDGAATAPAGAAPFSEPFPTATGAIFGGNDGKLYAYDFAGDNAAPTAGTVSPMFATGIVTAPIAVGGKTYAISNPDGNLKSVDGAVDITLGDAPTLALAATGSAAGSSLVVATNGGTVAALPF